MKISNKKIIVSTLALAMGAALAGSISGSVAWYQYSTRASAQIVGTSAGTEGRLQVKKSTEDDSAYSYYTSFDAAQFKPLSVKKATDGTLTFYEHPVYQYAQLQEATSGYVDYTLNFRFQKNTANPQSWQDVTDKNIYLSYFSIEKATSATVDVTSAVRVAFLEGATGNKAKFILAPYGTDGSAVTTSTKQKLDMGGATGLDKSGWDCLDTSGSDIEYTTGADSYATDAHASVLADVSNPYTIDTASGNSAKILSTTAASNALRIRVWIEGFANIGSSAIWDATTIAQSFNINMQFQCQADK